MKELYQVSSLCLNDHQFQQEGDFVCAWGLSHPGNFPSLQRKCVNQTSSYTVQLLLHSVSIHAECIPSIRGQEMMCVRYQYQLLSISCTWETYSASLHQFRCHPHIPTETNPCVRWTNVHSHIGTFSHSSPNKGSAQLMDGHTNFVQEITRDPQSLTIILARHVMEHISKRLGIPSKNFEQSGSASVTIC